MTHGKCTRGEVMEEIPRVFIEAWGVYEALRKLGFEDDDISYVYGPILSPGETEHEELLQVRLATQDQQFICPVGRLPAPLAECGDLMVIFTRAVAEGTISDEDLTDLWRSTRIGGDASVFNAMTASLVSSGFIIPASVGLKGFN